MTSTQDKCESIRTNLNKNKIDTTKYDLCYTNKISLQKDVECSLCRHDKNSKSFICRPNEFEEQVLSVKDFCTPLKKVPVKEIENIYYPSVINVCKSYKNKLSSSNKSYSKKKSSSRNKE